MGISAPTTPPSPIDTAIAETRFHRENFLRATSQPPIELEMRCYLADVACELHDLRGRRMEMPDIYDPASYAASQKLGRELRDGRFERHRLRQRAAQWRRMRRAIPAAPRAERAPERASAVRVGRQRHLRGLRDPRRQPVAPQDR